MESTLHNAWKSTKVCSLPLFSLDLGLRDITHFIWHRRERSIWSSNLYILHVFLFLQFMNLPVSSQLYKSPLSSSKPALNTEISLFLQPNLLKQYSILQSLSSHLPFTFQSTRLSTLYCVCPRKVSHRLPNLLFLELAVLFDIVAHSFRNVFPSPILSCSWLTPTLLRFLTLFLSKC